MTFEEQNNYIYKMKQSFINGTLSNVPQKYAAIVRDWRESQRAGVDPTLKSLTESARDVHVFDRIDDLQKCHIAYFKDYYKSRSRSLAAPSSTSIRSLRAITRAVTVPCLMS